jgi:hypothetical protein
MQSQEPGRDSRAKSRPPGTPGRGVPREPGWPSSRLHCACNRRLFAVRQYPSSWRARPRKPDATFSPALSLSIRGRRAPGERSRSLRRKRGIGGLAHLIVTGRSDSELLSAFAPRGRRHVVRIWLDANSAKVETVCVETNTHSRIARGCPVSVSPARKDKLLQLADVEIKSALGVKLTG